MSGFREKMAEIIAKSGDELWTLESYSDGAVVMWYIKDHNREREPQYQVWKGDKRKYVGSNRSEAYSDFEKQKDEFIMEVALI